VSRLEILLLCDYRRDIAATVVDHIEAVRRHSRHNVTVVSMLGDLPRVLELGRFDVVIVHYTLVMCIDDYVSPATRRALAAFGGLKVAFIQDEYRFVDRTIAAMREIGINLLFTCVPEGEIEKVYPAGRLPGVIKVNVLTGYVPEALTRYPDRPYTERPIDIGYRSRDVPEWLGEMGREKTRIGAKVLQDARRYSLVVDCSTCEADRIYGEDWIRFLQSCKAVLGVESGASVFDFTGEIQEAVEAHKRRDPSVSFETLQALYFADKEGLIDLRQVSPRCFEAACLGTLMVLYEGRYSGILEPWRHYVPLKMDHANMAEVVEVIRDPERAMPIIECARREIALSERWSYAAFAAKVDGAIERSFSAANRAVLPAYESDAVRRLLFVHRVRNRLAHARRRAFTHTVLLVDAGIRRVLPRDVQQPTRDGLKRAYERMSLFFGRRAP